MCRNAFLSRRSTGGPSERRSVCFPAWCHTGGTRIPSAQRPCSFSTSVSVPLGAAVQTDGVCLYQPPPTSCKLHFTDSPITDLGDIGFFFLNVKCSRKVSPAGVAVLSTVTGTLPSSFSGDLTVPVGPAIPCGE